MSEQIRDDAKPAWLVSEELPKRGLIVIRGDFVGEEVGQELSAQTGLTVLHLPHGTEIDVIDLDEMRRLGWMPVPKEDANEQPADR